MAERIFGDIAGVSVAPRSGIDGVLRMLASIDFFKRESPGAARKALTPWWCRGGYEEDLDRGDEIVHTGHGNPNNRKRIADQTLTKGKLALFKNQRVGLLVRRVVGRIMDRLLRRR